MAGKPGISQYFASEIDAELRQLPLLNIPVGRDIRRKYSQKLKQEKPEVVMALAKELIETYGYRWIAYELIRNHPATFCGIGADELEALGQGINSWWTVDSFARTLSGPAWFLGIISDELIHSWAVSADPWWRRAALVSTVVLNVRSQGGKGDTQRTLTVCRLLADDPKDMVVKAISWALRELVVHDPAAVRGFLQEHANTFAPRVKREVGNKIQTGLKNPKQKRAQ